MMGTVPGRDGPVREAQDRPGQTEAECKPAAV